MGGMDGVIDPFADPYLGKDVGSFHVDGRLGQGGMGIVYRALHRNLNRPVAFKILRTEGSDVDEADIQRFHAEALAYAKVRHPNVVEIYESGTADGVNYLALELVEGEVLADVVRRRGPLPFDEIVDLGVQLCGALTSIHAAGLVHRDIKLGNVILTASGTVKLMDFGVVRSRTGRGARASDEVGGTLRCMAPEVVDGAPGDSRADIFQLGVLLYETLTANSFNVMVPTFLEDVEASFFAATADELRPDVSDGLKDLILRCLQRMPALRFQSAGVVERELVRIRREGPDAVSRRRFRPAAPPGAAIETFRGVLGWVRNYWRLHPQHIVTACFVAFVVSVGLVAWWLVDDQPGPTAPAAASERVLGPGESVEVAGRLDGFRISWDLTDVRGLVLNGSYRVGDGEPVFIEQTFSTLAGCRDVPIPGLTPSAPTAIGWRLMAGDRKLAGGVAHAGFQRLVVGAQGGGAAVAVRAARRLFVGRGDGMLSCLSLGGDGRLPALRWSCPVAPGEPLSGLLVGDDACFVAAGSKTTRMVRLTTETRQDGPSTTPFAPAAGEWQTPPTFGRATDEAALVDGVVYWVTAVPAGDRLFLVGYEAATGRSAVSKVLRGAAPEAPVAVGRHLLLAYHRDGRAVVSRIEPRAMQRIWHHAVDEALTGPLVIDGAGLHVYFQTTGHLHRLRLFDQPVEGERLKVAALGDFRVELPGPASRFRLQDEGLVVTTMTGDGNVPELATLLPGQRDVQRTPLPFVVRDGRTTVGGSPAPLTVGGRICVPLADSLCWFEASLRTEPTIHRFAGRLVFVGTIDGRMLVVDADGACFCCPITD